MKAIIIGAGIAGLAAARGLQRIGWEVQVYEQAAVLKPLGAGLVLSANALKALKVLGLLETVLKAGQPLHNFSILDKKGRVLTHTNHLQLGKRFGIQSAISIHRGDLQEALLQLPHPLTVHTNQRFKSLVQDWEQVSVNFEDGTSDAADLLLACDGIHSAIRQQLVPQAKKRYAGYTCWRGVTNQYPANLNPHSATESWGAGDRFGLVPLSRDRVYWFACLNAARPQDPAMKAIGLPELQQRFGNYHTPIGELLQLTPPQALLWNDIIDLEPLTTYTYGRIALLGDAAHATTPNMGQGACQALEGTAVLMAQLAKYPLGQALAEYNRLRVPRAGGIVNRSWQLGKIAQLTHPVAVWLRNKALQLTPRSFSDKQLDELLGISLEQIPTPIISTY
ncbi:MAG: FAD-dependent monooxygenase [Bacteroidetes bacterium]|nr:FAD-dependent monooxygenase [Bacteroidota bacterium]